MKKYLLILLILPLTFIVQAQTVTTVAGNGSATYSGDNGAATAAGLNGPYGIATDGSGNLYIADRWNYLIRKVNPAGIITTVAGIAGIPYPGYSADNIPATSAMLSDVTGVAADVLGNIYIADRFNNRIRKVSTAGIITTVAGNGNPGYSGDGGPATNANIREPRGVAADGIGNVYIADAGNNCIRRVNPLGIISTVAGNGTAGYDGDEVPGTATRLYSPYGLAIDNAGNLLITDVDNARIRRLDATYTIHLVAGTGTTGYSGDGGPATSAAIREPVSITTDNNGNIFFTDSWNHCVRMINPAGNITTIAGSGVAGYNGDGLDALATQLQNPYGVAMGNGKLYIGDNGNNRIRSVAKPTATALPQAPSLGMQLYPNPAVATFTLMVNTPANEMVNVTMTNINGAVVWRDTCISNRSMALAPRVAAGTYLVTASTMWGKMSTTVIMEQDN